MMTNKNEDTETTGKLEVNSPHDKTVRKFLQEIDTAKSLFREYLPGKITDLLDLDSLEYMKEKFVDETLSKYYSDFLYKVNFKNKIDGFIFLLLEHKSWPARYTALQALKYIFKPTIKNKLPEIIQLFKEIKNKNTCRSPLVKGE